MKIKQRTFFLKENFAYSAFRSPLTARGPSGPRGPLTEAAEREVAPPGGRWRRGGPGPAGAAPEPPGWKGRKVVKK